MESIEWIKRGQNIEPYITDVDLFEFWELTTRSEARKQQQPTRRHIPKDTVSLNATEELQKFKPQVKAEPTPRSTGLRTPVKERKPTKRLHKLQVPDDFSVKNRCV